MEHSVESLIMDLESSIFTPPTVEQLDAAQAILEKAARPPWTEDEPFDVEDIIAKGMSGEVLPIPFERLSKTAMASRETSVEEISKVCADVLRRLSTGDSLKVDSDDEPPEDNPADDEPPEQEEPPAELESDIQFLKSERSRGTDLYELTNELLHSDLSRARQLQKALAWVEAA